MNMIVMSVHDDTNTHRTATITQEIVSNEVTHLTQDTINSPGFAKFENLS